MDPDQPKTPDQNLPIPDAPNNSYMDNVNKPQTPAFNDTDYWNTKSEDSAPKITEPVNPPEPLSAPEPVLPVEPETTNYSQPEPEETVSVSSVADTSSQTTDSSYQKWDDGPVSVETPSTSDPVSPPPSDSEPTKSNTLTVVMVVLVAVLLGATALFAFQNSQLKKQATTVARPTPTYEATPSATPDPMASWDVYTDSVLGISFKVASKDRVVKSVASLSDYAKGIISVTDKFIFNSSALALCPDEGTSTKACLNPGKNHRQELNIQPTTLGGKEAVSFYVVTPNAGSVVHVIQTIATPKIEIATDIGGMALEENFKLILSTFTFTSASPSPAAAGTCEKGYKAFAGEGYSLCYPETLVKAASSTTGQVVFENSNEILKITQNFQGGWGGSQCLFIDKATVSGYASKRLSWKTEQTSGGGCDNTYTAFAEMVNEGNFKFPFPYALELTAKNAPFPDNSKFLTIEKSFQVTNPNPSPNGS